MELLITNAVLDTPTINGTGGTVILPAGPTSAFIDTVSIQTLTNKVRKNISTRVKKNISTRLKKIFNPS